MWLWAGPVSLPGACTPIFFAIVAKMILSSRFMIWLENDFYDCIVLVLLYHMYTICSSNIAENHYRQLNLFLNKPWVVDLVVFPVSNGLSIGQDHLIFLVYHPSLASSKTYTCSNTIKERINLSPNLCEFFHTTYPSLQVV